MLSKLRDWSGGVSDKSECQRLLTVGIGACSGVLELLEALVDCQSLPERLCALWTDDIVKETANGAKVGCQRLLTVGFEANGAYLSEVRALFSFRPSEMCFAPSASSWLNSKLPTGAENKRQRLLTVGKRAGGAYLSVWRAVFVLRASPSA